MPIDSDLGTVPIVEVAESASGVSSSPSSSLVRNSIALLAAVLIFAGLATALAMTKAPWCDEGAFANPSYNLAFHGKMSANVINPSGHYLNAYLRGIQERTYIVVPNHLVALAGWYRIFGFSLLSMRAYSILWGAIALPILFYIFWRLIPNPGVAQLATLLTAIDFVYLWVSADGRMESSANTLAFGSIAAYLYLRERGLGRAVLMSQLLSAAAVFTHPNAVLTQLVLAVLVWHFDRTRLRWQHLFLASAPYVLFGALWAIYIAQSPGDFSAQFFANAAGRSASRWKTIFQPWMAVWNEIIRQLGVYVSGGLWSGVMNKYMLLIPIGYTVALAAVFRKWKTYEPLVKTFLASTVAMIVGLTILNGFKAPMYIASLLPWYNAVLAFGLVRLWKGGRDGKLAAVAAGVGFAALQLTTSVQHIRADEYRRDYLPVIAFLQQEQAAGKSIVGTAALGFGLGFTGFEDDWRLGEYSHLNPDVFVVDRSYRYFTKIFEREEPSVFSHVVNTLTVKYRLTKRFGTFWIFERATPASPPLGFDVRDIAMKEKGKQAEYLFEQIERSADTAAVKTSEDNSTHAAIRP